MSKSLPSTVVLTSLRFSNYKAFAKFSLSLKSLNVLVGPNNCGKSTIVGAFRLLAAGLRRANSRKVESVPSPGQNRSLGHPVVTTEVPVSLENVHTDYSDKESLITFRLSNRNILTLFFPVEGGCYLIPVTEGRIPRSPSAFAKAFPISVAVVPVLGPVEHNEPLVQETTVNREQFTHRASRHFRNYWHYNRRGFDDFAALVRETWAGMDVLPPEPNYFENTISMFCKEGRIDRELYWAGFGFQVWCQMLTHVSRSSDRTILVVDEPEIYLHPEVQRRLLKILREAGPDILLATHSTEILSEAEPSDILLVDKLAGSAKRLKDVEQVQAALEAIGSIQNITLAQLARNRKIVFVENQSDFVILRRFAGRAGFVELAAGGGLTAVESEGAASWKRLKDVSWGIQKTLGDRLRIAAVFDRDYRSSEECDDVVEKLSPHLVFCHIHDRKEIENYLLEPEVVDRALYRALRERELRTGEPSAPIRRASELLEELSQELHDDARAQYVARRWEFLRREAVDQANVSAETLRWFEAKWSTLEGRLRVVSGKKLIRRLRGAVQEQYGVTLTDYRLISAFRVEEIAPDLLQLLSTLEHYRSA